MNHDDITFTLAVTAALGLLYGLAARQKITGSSFACYFPCGWRGFILAILSTAALVADSVVRWIQH